jgi:outer membrane lipoprotein-sorting protein
MPCAWVAADAQAAGTPKLSAEQIVERNIVARGGLAAWHRVHALRVSGRMDIGGRKSMEVPFRSEMKRPRKVRFELDFQGQKAVQTYDGVHGWKMRPYLGRNDAEPFTPQEQQSAAQEQELDGPLIDYRTKGTKVALEGTEAVEGHDAYKLKLTLKDGSVRRDWIDAKSFLEVKIEGEPRRLDGRLHGVEITYRDYRSVSGLMIPHVLETAVQGVKGTRKMTVETVEVNPKIDDSAFLKPQVVTAAADTGVRAAAGSKSR